MSTSSMTTRMILILDVRSTESDIFPRPTLSKSLIESCIIRLIRWYNYVYKSLVSLEKDAKQRMTHKYMSESHSFNSQLTPHPQPLPFACGLSSTRKLLPMSSVTKSRREPFMSGRETASMRTFDGRIVRWENTLKTLSQLLRQRKCHMKRTSHQVACVQGM